MNPEGHDDAPQTGDNNSVKPTQPEPQAPQGIFSSGDLAVHSENLDAIKPELSDENKSRIASAFAQTDATQKHDQLADQMAEQDAVSGDVIPATNATTSTITGDIQLPGKRGKRKWPVLVLAVIVLAVVAGGVWWMMRGNGGGEETLQELYTSFMDCINNSPDGNYIYDGAASSIGDTEETAPPQSDDSEPSANPQENNEPNGANTNPGGLAQDTNEGAYDSETDRSQRFIFVADALLSGDDLSNYYAEVDTRYNKFIEKARNDKNQTIKTAADANYGIFPAVFVTMRLSTIENKIAQFVYSGDITEAEAYITQLTPATSQQESINTMMTNFVTYLRQITPIYEIYKQEGCLLADTVDWGCVAELENNTAEYASLEAAEYLEDALTLAETYKKLVFSQLVSFGDLIKEAHEQN